MNFQTKINKTQFHFTFIFEIVLACSCGSLGTISSTNIFGAIAGDETKVYLHWDTIIHLILRGEQNQKIFDYFFTKQWFIVATRMIGTRGKPTSHLHLGVSDPEQILK